MFLAVLSIALLLLTAQPAAAVDDICGSDDPRCLSDEVALLQSKATVQQHMGAASSGETEVSAKPKSNVSAPDELSQASKDGGYYSTEDARKPAKAAPTPAPTPVPPPPPPPPPQSFETTKNKPGEGLEYPFENAIGHSYEVGKIEWNWITLQFGEAKNFPSDYGFGANAPDAKISISVVGDGCDAGYSGVTKHDLPQKTNTWKPVWYMLGVVAFKKGCPTGITVKVVDDDTILHDTILEVTLDIPKEVGKWGPMTMIGKKGGAQLGMKMRLDDTPTVSLADMQHMSNSMTEKIFDLKTGDTSAGANKASLLYKTSPDNTKAILYIPGRGDSFQHPHLLKLFLEMGFDLYTLDPRRIGRCRQYLDDPRLSSHSDDFNEYFEEFEETFKFIKKQKSYEKFVGYAHSTGAPILLNYVIENGDGNFDSFVFNGPFLDWGWVGGAFIELAMENLSGALTSVQSTLSDAVPAWSVGSGFSSWLMKIWMSYRFEPHARPLISTTVTSGWAKAVTAVFSKLEGYKTSGLTQKPTFLVAGKADDVLKWKETSARSEWVNPAVQKVILDHNCHDVTLSFTKQLTDDAVNAIKSFLAEIRGR